MNRLFEDYNDQKILDTGILKPKTLESYKSGTRKARPVTIIAVAQALGARWQNYV